MNGKKISAHVVGGALAIIAVWLINSFTKVVVTAEVAVAFGTMFGFIVSVLTPDSMEADEDGPASKQGGFALIGMVISLLGVALLALSLSGCGTTDLLGRSIEPIAVPTSLPEAGQTAQKAVNEANAALAAAYRLIGDNAEAGVWTKAQAQGYMNTVDGYSKKADEAQDALDRGMWATAQSQAELVNRLILALSKEVAAQARKADTQK